MGRHPFSLNFTLKQYKIYKVQTYKTNVNKNKIKTKLAMY